MKILEDDFKCGQFWLEYISSEPINLSMMREHMIHSLHIFTEDFVEPYALDIVFARFDEDACIDQDLGSYHLTLNKPHIHSKSPWANSTIRVVPEIDSSQLFELCAEIAEQNNPYSDHVGISAIDCLSGLYYLPHKTDKTQFIKYTGAGGPDSETKRPIYNGMGIEAPLSEFHDLWAPIEIRMTFELGRLRLNVILNWDLYGKQNEEGFQMLRKAFLKLIHIGWTNTMPQGFF